LKRLLRTVQNTGPVWLTNPGVKALNHRINLTNTLGGFPRRRTTIELGNVRAEA
jgi:hypothetical protein